MRFSALWQLCLAGIIATFALAGCGSGHSGGAGGAGGGVGTGYGIFSWQIHDIEDSAPTLRTALDCASVGAASVVVTLTNQATGTVYTEIPASCAAGYMTTAEVPTGAYTLGFDLYGDQAIYGNSTTLLDSFDATETFHILAGANDFTPKTYASFIVQSFTVTWDLYYQSQPTTCAAMGATHVYLDFLVEGATTWVSNPFACTSKSGTSYAIPFGPKTVQWTLSLVAVDTLGNATDLQVINGPITTLPTDTNVNLLPQYFSF